MRENALWQKEQLKGRSWTWLRVCRRRWAGFEKALGQWAHWWGLGTPSALALPVDIAHMDEVVAKRVLRASVVVLAACHAQDRDKLRRATATGTAASRH